MTRRKTGGTWGGAIGPHRYFTAGQNTLHTRTLYLSRLLAVNELSSAAQLETEFVPLLDAGVPVLLDSGVFWLANSHAKRHGIPMDAALALPPDALDDWDALYATYCQLVERYGNQVWGYIELDQGGRAQKCRTRAGLEAQGLAPIPVYHPFNDGWDYFDTLCQGYDRICVGNVVQAPPAVRLRIFATIWERQRQYPDVWIHYLGVTPTALQCAYPVQSCDSSTWLACVRWSDGVRYWTDSCLTEIGGLFTREFFYQRGEGVSADRSRAKAGMCAAYHAALFQKNWYAICGATTAHGFALFPTRHSREPLLVPART